jgi:transposase
MRETAKKICVGSEDRQRLEGFSKGEDVSPRVARRAQAVLRIADGDSPTEVAQDLGWTPSKVIQWRERYREGGVDAVLDRRRPGAPRKYEREEVLKQLKQLLQEQPPEGYGKWTGALLANALTMNRHVVWQLLRREGISVARRRS